MPSVNCENLFSDALHRPFFCAQLEPVSYIFDIPRANKIPRLPDLTLEDFTRSWTNRPFILTEPVKRWPVYRDWDERSLLSKYGTISFAAEAVEWPLKTYLEYMNQNEDESPLYLFDSRFAEKMGLSDNPKGEYVTPTCFGDDLFSCLGRQRPDHRWLIIGPKRSGSTFHKDPNATSAWNAVVRGSKYWIMFPSSIIPPGVYMSEDQSEVTSPLSIAEWLLTFHQAARHTGGCLEGICAEGEVLHVPSGWWHLVVNLEPAIAITQNFVPRAHLNAALDFLKNKADQVSGFGKDVVDPYALFLERLSTKYPELVSMLENSATKKRKWEDVIGNNAEETGRSPGGFTFGFGDDFCEDDV